MIRQAIRNPVQLAADAPLCRDNGPMPTTIATEAECLEQLLEAFRDIADRDDIHQAAERLLLAQEWIRREAKRAAADPIFSDLRLAS
jgi:hypothetical protein